LVSGKMEEDLKNKVKAQSVTAYLSGDGTDTLYVPFYPVIALYGSTDAEKLASLQSRDDPDDAWADLSSDLDHIYIDSVKTDRIKLLDGEAFPSGDSNIKVVYYAGYSDPPADIQLVVMEKVQLMWMESGRGGNLLGTQSIGSEAGGVSRTFNSNLDKRWEQVVRKYTKQLHVTEMYR